MRTSASSRDWPPRWPRAKPCRSFLPWPAADCGAARRRGKANVPPLRCLAMSAQRVEEAIEAIRASGSRVTVDRRAVVEALDRSGDHQTAEQVAEAVWVHHPDVNLATVYRTLELLEKLEIAFHVHLGHGP